MNAIYIILLPFDFDIAMHLTFVPLLSSIGQFKCKKIFIVY